VRAVKERKGNGTVLRAANERKCRLSAEVHRSKRRGHCIFGASKCLRLPKSEIADGPQANASSLSCSGTGTRVLAVKAGR
jgi:hypothetical protein